MSGEKIIVAVDGPAGSGKSTVSREVARRLKLKYIDSGAVYRSITWFFLQKHDILTSATPFGDNLHNIVIEQNFTDEGLSITRLNGEDVTDKIRDERIAVSIGVVSDNPDVRNFVNNLLKNWSKKNSIIMDGRDIGSVVFPDADVKIYLDASVDVRTGRRAREYEEKGKTVDVNKIKKQIIRRDEEDTSRQFGRLKKTPDALYVDTSSMSLDQVVEWMVETVAAHMERNNP